MLERTLAIVLLALLPMALGQFPISENVVWRSCAAIAFAAAPTSNWSLLYRLRKIPSYAPGRAWILWGQGSLALGLSVLVAGFLGLVPLASAYGLALLIELASAGGMFLRVIASITTTPARQIG